MCGALGVAALEVVRLLAGLPSPAAVLVLALALSAALFLAARRIPRLVDEPLEARRAGWSRLERAALAVAVALVLTAALFRSLEVSLTVIHANDEAGFWSKRAKYLFEARGFGGSYAEAIQLHLFPNASYPLLNSLLELWVMDCAGGITHVANRFPIQLCTLALCLTTAAACRRAGRPWIAAALLVVFAASTPAGLALSQANSDFLVALGGL